MRVQRPASPQMNAVPRKKGDDWWWQIVVSDDGGRGPHHDLGPLWPTNRDAYRYMDLMAERRQISPLRAE
jgi:hypothetical protein